jgi:polar amino acid transport system substrate-binding protein
MLRCFYALAVAVLLLSACTGGAASPDAPTPVMTVPPGVTPLVTQVGVVRPANHLEEIKQAGVIRVGVSADYPPFEYLDSSGNRAGFDIELMGEIAGRMNVLLEWVDMPFNDLIGAVQSGQVDAAISALQHTEERDQQVDFTQPYYTSEDAFLALEGFDGQISMPEDAAGYTVGVQPGTIQEAWIRKNLVDAGKMPAASLHTYDNAEAALQGLQAGEIQLLMVDHLPAQALANQEAGLAIVYRGVVTGGPLHIIVPDGDAELQQAINEILAQLQQEGFIQDLALRMMTEPQ